MPIYNLPSQSHPPFTAVRSESCTPSVPGSPKTDFPPLKMAYEHVKMPSAVFEVSRDGCCVAGVMPKKRKLKNPFPQWPLVQRAAQEQHICKGFKIPIAGCLCGINSYRSNGSLSQSKSHTMGNYSTLQAN